MSKVYSLHDAVKNFVKDGDQLATGGFTTNRKPYAAIYEILRQGQKDLIVHSGPAGGDLDMLAGAGRIKAYINCYSANSGFSQVSRRFRSAIEKGEMLFEDYSQDAMLLAFTGAALGFPYVPLKVMFGSDILNKWGISEEVRKTIPKLPEKKLIVQDDPFNPNQKLVLIPTPRLDLALIHAQKASPDGTVRIEGDEFHDVDIAIAAKRCIVTCEELVSNEEIRRDPQQNKIPGFCVDAIVHVPHGAHPAQCYNYYDHDPEMLTDYESAGKSDEAFNAFMQEWVYGPKTHEEYLAKVGINRLIARKVVPGVGYVPSKKGEK